MQFSESLSAPAQSAYSDLLGVVREDELSRSIEHLSGNFSKKRTLKIDFLTPAKPGARASAFKHEQLGVNLQPIEFLEFVLEDVTQTALLAPSGAVLVNVPAPARYALHKLLVHVRRGEREKAPKDLRQAAALLEVLGPGAELKALWRDLVSRGGAWKEAARSGREKLKHLAPKLPALKSLA